MFNVGDRVRLLQGETGNECLRTGATGTICDGIIPRPGVKWDGFHAGWGEDGDCWRVDREILELVPSGTPIEVAYTTRPVVAEWWNEYIYEYKWLSEYKSSIYLSRHPLIHVNPATIKEG